MGLMDKIKKMTGTGETPYNDNNYDDDYYNEFDDSYDDLDEGVPGDEGGNQGGGYNANVGGLGLSGSGSPIEMIITRPTTFKSATQIADHLLNKRTVVLNLVDADKETGRKLIDFLTGVAYSISGGIRSISPDAFIITPDNVEISKDSLLERKKQQPPPEEENFADF